jgi:hypothetical protein
MSLVAAAAPAPTHCAETCTVEAAAVWGSDLPGKIELQGYTLLLDGARLTGTSAERDAVLLGVLSQAEGNADRVNALYARQSGALALAAGGAGLELGGVVVALAVASGLAPATLGTSLALPIGLAGAGVGLTGVGLGLSNRPLRRAVDHYNAWAQANPAALVVDPGSPADTPAAP